MHDPHGQLMPWIIRLASSLPGGMVVTLAQAIGAYAPQQWGTVQFQAAQVVPQPHLRSLLVDMLTAWQQQAPGVEPVEVALMLRTAAATTRSVREAQMVELVWTGPLVAGPAMRRTDQALLQVITEAQKSLLIVSFAVYKIAAIAGAIVRAAERGVAIRICVEAPEPSGQKMAHDTIRALGQEVAQRAAIYVWPSDKRPTDENGRAGVLHAKCAVADSRLLFVSSANLTDNAMTLNMELGVLVQSVTHLLRPVVVGDDHAIAFCCEALVLLADDTIPHAQAINVELDDFRADRDGVGVGERELECAARSGQNWSNPRLLCQRKPSNLLEVGNPGAFKVAEIDRVIHMLESIHLTPGHGKCERHGKWS